MTLGFACGADSYTSRDRETYTETTTATAGDVHDTATESVCICRHTGPNLSSPPLVLVAVVLLSSPMAEGGSLFSLRGHRVGAPGRHRVGARGSRSQQLVDAIIELGHLPTQCKDASLEEKRLAVQLIRAKKAGALSSQQEDVLRILAQDQAEATAGSGVH